MTVRRPETSYARSGDVYIAYQVVGEGSISLVHTPGAISHLDSAWDLPSYVRYLSRLAGSFRVVLFDKRGTGMSDRTAGIATLEERMDDTDGDLGRGSDERAVRRHVSGADIRPDPVRVHRHRNPHRGDTVGIASRGVGRVYLAGSLFRSDSSGSHRPEQSQ